MTLRSVSLSVLLALLMLVATLTPLAVADNGNQSEDAGEAEPYFAIGDLSEFNPVEMGKPYLFTGEDGEAIYSATRHLKQQWRDAGYPNLVLPFSDGDDDSQLAHQQSAQSKGRTSGRACENAWQTGQTGQVQTTSGFVTFTVRKVSMNSAVLIQNGQSVSSTTLNNIGSTWETTIYPTDTTYFGVAPDVDNNCQVEIMIYAIDGGGNTGGYFMPSLASQREVIFVDIDDLSWRDTILAHEFQHLLHNARDPFEYIWIDEGNADMAVYLCFGATNAVIGHANTWTQNSSQSLRWWNQRLGDYGAGFLFMLFLADKLGGGAAIAQLVSDSATGGTGIVNLATILGPGSNDIGSDFSSIYANFTAAVTLDDATTTQFGLSNIDMYQSCASNQFCRIQLSDTNQNWGGMWQSTDHDLEGWGVHAFRFLGGTGAPLNIMVVPSEFGFNGKILRHDVASNAWVMEDMRFDPVTGVGTGLVHGFGNQSDDVYLLVWYESGVDDCDYSSPNCAFPGGSTAYPIASVDIFAGLITQPASIRIDQEYTYDRDGDLDPDSLEVTFSVNSTAFYEVLDVEVLAFENNVLHDTINMHVEAGGGVAVTNKVWYTPPWEGNWTLAFRMRDQLGFVVDEQLTLPLHLYNMAPVAEGSAAANSTQTWLPLQFFGAGYDLWGLAVDNMSFSHNVTPTGYIWDFGDGLSGSGLKNPLRSWQTPGVYNVTLQVVDQGNGVSAIQNWTIDVQDTLIPIVIITVAGQEVQNSMTLLTSQRVLFSGITTQDNVPFDYLTFTWDWGDGTSESGMGLYEASHEWAIGSANGTPYNLTLTVDDGTHIGNISITVMVYNRVPRQVFFQPMTAYTLTPLPMPDVFTDDDGIIVATLWQFDEGVNLAGGIVTMSSDFSVNFSADPNPTPAWRTPGVKNVTIIATDDAGNSSIAILTVTVLNQRPVAIFERPSDGTTETEYAFHSSSFDPDGNSGNMTHNWTLSDMESSIIGQNAIVHTFTEPGHYTVTLIVTDERGLDSLAKTYIIHIANPLPMPMMSVYEAWINGEPILAPGPDDLPYEWRHSFTSDGGIFVAPGTVLRFSSDGSRDADAAFDGMYDSNISSPNWNGIVEYTWDFGDASPPSSSPNSWHIFNVPGVYTITLTVRDGFGTGDSNRTTRSVWVSHAPEIVSQKIIDSDYILTEQTYVFVGWAQDADLLSGIGAWRDDDVNNDSNGDGILDNDPDTVLNEALTYWWDTDDSFDANGNGNLHDDWEQGVAREGAGIDVLWNESTVVTISLKVCDDTGVCTQQAYVITVRSPDSVDQGVGDLSWSDILPSGDGSLWMIVLIALVLLLGWLVMRQPEEVEIAAGDAASTYDVAEVHTEGGVLGMDQHIPPPKPKHLTKDDRRSNESGYVRPVTSHRRR